MDGDMSNALYRKLIAAGATDAEAEILLKPISNYIKAVVGMVAKEEEKFLKELINTGYDKSPVKLVAKITKSTLLQYLLLRYGQEEEVIKN